MLANAKTGINQFVQVELFFCRAEHTRSIEKHGPENPRPLSGRSFRKLNFAALTVELDQKLKCAAKAAEVRWVPTMRHSTKAPHGTRPVPGGSELLSILDIRRLETAYLRPPIEGPKLRDMAPRPGFARAKLAAKSTNRRENGPHFPEKCLP